MSFLYSSQVNFLDNYGLIFDLRHNDKNPQEQIYSSADKVGQFPSKIYAII